MYLHFLEEVTICNDFQLLKNEVDPKVNEESLDNADKRGKPYHLPQ